MTGNLSDSVQLDVQDVAALLYKSPESVRRYCRSGLLHCYSFGGRYLILGSDLKKFMGQQEDEGCQDDKFV